MPIFPEDIDQAVGAFNACDRCGSVTHTPFDKCPWEQASELYPGDIVEWWPRDTDYPSWVELIKPLGPDDGYPEGSWRVNYFREPIETEWVIPLGEIGERVFDV